MSTDMKPALPLKFTKATILFLTLLLVGSFAQAAERYGDALVEKGQMTIVRSGKRLAFKSSASAVPVEQGDLIRVRKNSKIVLNTIEKSIISLGANSVFQVKPFQKKESKGFFRMLFGRFRAKVTGLTRGQEFNIKTATATIGVKGTEYFGFTTGTGATGVAVTESNIVVIGNDGVTRSLPTGFFSMAFSQGASAPVPTPPALTQAFSGDNLDAPAPGSEQANDIPAEDAIVESGAATVEQMEDSKNEQLELDLDVDEVPVIENILDTSDLDLDDAQQTSQSVKGTLDVEFEK